MLILPPPRDLFFFSLLKWLCSSKEKPLTEQTFDCAVKVLEEDAIKATCPFLQTFPPCFRQSRRELG